MIVIAHCTGTLAKKEGKWLHFVLRRRRWFLERPCEIFGTIGLSCIPRQHLWLESQQVIYRKENDFSVCIT